MRLRVPVAPPVCFLWSTAAFALVKARVKSWSGSAVRIPLHTVWFVVRRLFWPQPMARTTLRLRAGSAPPTQRFATGVSGGSNWGSSDFTEKPGQGGQKLMTKKKLRNCCVWFCGANLQTALIGRFARQHQSPVCQKAQWGACWRCSVFTASLEKLQALDRSPICRQGEGYRRP